MKKPILLYESSSGTSRKAYRTRVPGLAVKDCATRKVYPVQDISAAGVSLMDEEGTLKEGDGLHMDVVLKDRSIVAGLLAEVARRHGNVAGLKFKDLTQRQEERLDKLVLEVQKYLISKSKMYGSDIDDEHKT